MGCERLVFGEMESGYVSELCGLVCVWLDFVMYYCLYLCLYCGGWMLYMCVCAWDSLCLEVVVHMWGACGHVWCVTALWIVCEWRLCGACVHVWCVPMCVVVMSGVMCVMFWHLFWLVGCVSAVGQCVDVMIIDCVYMCVVSMWLSDG